MDREDAREPVTKEVRLLVPIEKADSEKRITYGVVLEPDTEDLQGDVMTAEDIEKAVYDWMERSQRGGKMHVELVDGAKTVESFLAPCDFEVETAEGPETVLKGSWVLAMRWPEDVWEDVKKGRYTTYSVGGTGVRLALEEVGKKGEWAPGPNAGWRRAHGDPARDGSAAEGGGTPADRGAAAARRDDKARPKTYHSDEAGEVTVPEDDDSPARPEDEERDEELRRSRRSTKPKENAEDAYAAAMLGSFGKVDEVEALLQDRQAPSDDFQPDWEDAGSAGEIENRLAAVMGFLSGDEDAYAGDPLSPPKFKTAEDAYASHMLNSFDLLEGIRESIQDRPAPTDEFQPDWGHVGDANEVDRRLGEVLSFLGGGEVDTSPGGRTHFFSAKPKPGFKEPTPATGNTYFWSQKRAGADPSPEAIDKAVREGLRDAVAKAGKWAPGPNAGWRRASDDDAALTGHGADRSTPRLDAWHRSQTASTPDERRQAAREYERLAGEDDDDELDGYPSGTVDDEERYPTGGKWAGESEKHTTRDGVVIEDQPKVQHIKNSEMFASGDGRVQLNYGAWKWLGASGSGAKHPKLNERGNWGVWPRGADHSDPINVIWSGGKTLAEFINSLDPGEYDLAT